LRLSAREKPRSSATVSVPSRAASEPSPSRKIYVANAREAAEEAGTANDAAALERQPPTGFSDAIVKLGADGAAVLDGTTSDNGMARIPAFPVAVSTTIGAGDVFAGAVAAGLAEGVPLVEAAVSKPATIDATPAARVLELVGHAARRGT
jgi:sugar/nucleoside kinase (ribokinase family)